MPADSSNDSLLTTADHINKLTHWEGKPLPCQSLLHITHHKRQCGDPPAASPATTNVLNLAKIEEAMTPDWTKISGKYPTEDISRQHRTDGDNEGYRDAM